MRRARVARYGNPRARMQKHLLSGALIALGVATAAGASGDEKERYFFFGYEYGSQTLYGPLYVFLNRGFDILQIRPGSRNVFDQPYGSDAANLARNLANPFPAIADDGWGKFLREEIFPLSYTDETARWVPNYTLHLLDRKSTRLNSSHGYISYAV